MTTYQVSARKDPMAEKFEAAGLQGRGFMPVYRKQGGQWLACRESRGAEGFVIIWCDTLESAKAAAKQWLRRKAGRRARGAVSA